MADESTGERLNRELNELLQGLRVLLPGVQVLFAFLLTVPFSQRFESVTPPQRRVYAIALLGAALAAAFLVAPSAMHRVLFRDRDKEWLIRVSNVCALVGTAFLAAAMGSALYLVIEVLYSSELALMIAIGAAIVFVGLWYVLPLVRRARNDA